MYSVTSHLVFETVLYLCEFRCCEVASLETLPQCVSTCWELLHSEAFFLLLSNFTGLRLHYLCPADDDDEEDEDKEKKNKREDERDGEATGSLTESANTSREKGVCQCEMVSPINTGVYVCFNFDFVFSSELSTPVCCSELRRWSHGSYTLLHDGEAVRAEYALDLLLPFGCTGEHTQTRTHTHSKNLYCDCF